MLEEESDISIKISQRINLEVMSQDALREYLKDLEQEILRVRHVLAEKDVARAGAEALFKK